MSEASPAPVAGAVAPEFRPFVSAEESPRELTLAALVTGSLLGIVFAASSVYLALKVGLTVSASIPIGVLSITLFRRFTRGEGTAILVNNIVQTTGSAGESIAAGVAFTLPALLLMGFEMEFGRVLLVGLLGGLLGVLMMIPLRHGLIVKEHGRLAYPEGTACAQVLVAGERGGMSARTVFQGFGVGALHTLLMNMCKFWKDIPEYVVNPTGGHFSKASVSGDLQAPLLGVGYIIGYRTSAEMMAGGVMSFLVFVPLIAYFGPAMPNPFGLNASSTVAEMSPYAIRNAYILYIGAGAVATGGFLSLARSLPAIVEAFRRGLGALGGGSRPTPKRTEQDLSMRVVLFGSLALVAAMTVAPYLDINAASAGLIVLFGFFFVTVSSRVTGELGSSSNPISGMTVATLLLTCLFFVAAGWTGVSYKAMALTTAALVCVAASNGGTISQDLKTGFLVGGTPRKQQLAILVGVVTSAVFIGGTMKLLDRGGTVVAPKSATFADVELPAAALAGADAYEHEGRAFRVWRQQETGARPPRGRYLVDDAGKIAFEIDSSLGVARWRLSPPDASYSDLEPPSAGAEIYAVDGTPFRVAKKIGTNSAYLADDASRKVAYAAAPVLKFDAPKPRLFSLIIDGILGGELPWTLVLVGVFLALMLELVGVSSLSFAVGAYLPIDASAPIFLGGIVRWWVDRRTKLQGADAESSPGVLISSGLIAGGAIAAILVQVVGQTEALGPMSRAAGDLGRTLFGDASSSEWLPLIPFALMMFMVARVGVSSRRPRA